MRVNGDEWHDSSPVRHEGPLLAALLLLLAFLGVWATDVRSQSHDTQTFGAHPGPLGSLRAELVRP